MSERGIGKIVGDDIDIVKSDLKFLKEEVSRISIALEKTCGKVQLLGVADELVELKREVGCIGSTVIDLKRIVEQVVYPCSPGSVMSKGISPSKGAGWNTSVRMNGFDEVKGNIMPGFSTPKGSNDRDGNTSRSRESKYARRNKGSEAEFVTGSKVFGKLKFDISPKAKVRSAKDYCRNKRKVPTFRAGPFVVERALEPLDLLLLKYAFEETLDKTEIVVELEFNDVIRDTFFTLKPQRCLDGEEAVISRNKDWIRFVSAQHLKERYMSNILNCKKAFFPILDEVSKHWFLLMLDMCPKKAEIWDSSLFVRRRDARSTMSKQVLESLDVLFDISDLGSATWKDRMFGSFNVLHRDDAPVQDNNFDCGMYVIAFMQDR